MSQLSNGILGVLAAGMTLGAIQFASGNDLSSAIHNRDDVNQAVQSKISESPSVNRTAKTDRFAVSTRSARQDKTLSFRVDQMPDTLVLIRVPTSLPIDSIKVTSSTQETNNTTARKSNVACEPVVSVLTDVAKVLEPGRCVT